MGRAAAVISAEEGAPVANMTRSSKAMEDTVSRSPNCMSAEKKSMSIMPIFDYVTSTKLCSTAERSESRGAFTQRVGKRSSMKSLRNLKVGSYSSINRWKSEACS
jgi:hypothetical protein